MQTPHNGSGITVDSWTEGDDAYCAAEPAQSTQFVSLLRRHLLWIIAITLAAASGSGLWLQATYQRHSTLIGELGYVELPDGSMAILNTATDIELDFTRDSRRVKLLRGEALFDVAPDPDRDFVVELAGFRVEAPESRSAVPRADSARVGWLVDYARDVATPLTHRKSRTLFATRGCTFTLRRHPGSSMELMVLEGSIKVRHRAPSSPNTLLVAEDTIVLGAKDGSLHTTTTNTPQLESNVGWLTQLIVLSADTDLREAAREFNRYNEVKLFIGEQLAERQIRGAFHADRPHDFARSLERATGAEIHVSGNLITIR